LDHYKIAAQYIIRLEKNNYYQGLFSDKSYVSYFPIQKVNLCHFSGFAE